MKKNFKEYAPWKTSPWNTSVPGRGLRAGVEDADRCHLHPFSFLCLSSPWASAFPLALAKAKPKARGRQASRASLPSIFRIEARPGKRRSPVNCQIKIFPDFIRAVDGAIYRYWVFFGTPQKLGPLKTKKKKRLIIAKDCDYLLPSDRLLVHQSQVDEPYSNTGGCNRYYSCHTA